MPTLPPGAQKAVIVLLAHSLGDMKNMGFTDVTTNEDSNGFVEIHAKYGDVTHHVHYYEVSPGYFSVRHSVGN